MKVAQTENRGADRPGEEPGEEELEAPRFGRVDSVVSARAVRDVEAEGEHEKHIDRND
jgi:hypothetical protein